MFTLRQLEIFREVIRARTTIGAARALNVSQPLVSNMIRQMEAKIGFPLFERFGNRLVPTPDADEIYHDSESIFSIYQAFTKRIEARQRSESGHLRVVGTPPMANALIPRTLKEFLSKRPAVRVHLDTRRITGVLESVQSRMADIGLGLNPPEREGLSYEVLAMAQMVCVFPPGHPLESKLAITSRDLVGQPLILYEPSSSLDLAISRDILTPELRAQAIAEVRYSSVACLMAEVGMGVAFVDSLTASVGDRYRLSARPLYPSQPVPICLITRKDEPAKRIQASFLAELRRSPTLTALREFGGDGPDTGH
ncbi:LysR family transcriptional regulator [Paracoccus alkanivorans]|uniref:LysR family transcriptional regulator n=1 Tax=Paracoccus alkanivorans TaxID=2116655 RepID=A0A3M0M7N7_9RHOB|nr:LysR family transcriptional regulator [Paracoccus alkanivorans]RMC33808.1 LysR family transcriptional regulator [Paracoccus alkanivorans]